MESNQPSGPAGAQNGDKPAPETLQPQDGTEQTAAPAGEAKHLPPHAVRRYAYRPSHRAAFVGIAVILLILGINVAVITFVLKGKGALTDQSKQAPVTINQASLDKLGVNRSAVGDKGVELVVNPNSRFNGKVQVAGDVSVAGELKLSSKFSASDASLTQLQAGNTQLHQLNVNGDGTLSGLNLRKDLTVAGATRLQGDVTLSRLLTVNNSANIAGNLAVGGSLTAGAVQTRNLTVTSTFTFGGHILTSGPAPGARSGNALGSNGTVSISGNDASGTVAINIGVGATAGTLATVSFQNNYGNLPHVVISPVGAGNPGGYISRSTSGFTIGTNTPFAPGGYAFDYIVMQ